MSPICPISSSSIHSLIFPLSSLTTSWTAVSFLFTSPAGFTFFHCFQFLSSLCQYWRSYSPSDHPNNLLVVYHPGNPPLQYSLSSSTSSCCLTSLLSLLYSFWNSLSKSPAFYRFFLLFQVSPSTVNPFHHTKNLSFPLTFLLFKILSTSYSSSLSSPTLTFGGYNLNLLGCVSLCAHLRGSSRVV